MTLCLGLGAYGAARLFVRRPGGVLSWRSASAASAWSDRTWRPCCSVASSSATWPARSSPDSAFGPLLKTVGTGVLVVVASCWSSRRSASSAWTGAPAGRERRAGQHGRTHAAGRLQLRGHARVWPARPAGRRRVRAVPALPVGGAQRPVARGRAGERRPRAARLALPRPTARPAAAASGRDRTSPSASRTPWRSSSRSRASPTSASSRASACKSSRSCSSCSRCRGPPPR